MEYDDDAVLSDYLVHNGLDFLDEVGRTAISVIINNRKYHLFIQDEELVDEFPDRYQLIEEWIIKGDKSDKVVDGAKIFTNDGRHFNPDYCREIEKKHPESILRCPECNRVVRTPRAKLCLWCGHDWR